MINLYTRISPGVTGVLVQLQHLDLNLNGIVPFINMLLVTISDCCNRYTSPSSAARYKSEAYCIIYFVWFLYRIIAPGVPVQLQHPDTCINLMYIVSYINMLLLSISDYCNRCTSPASASRYKNLKHILMYINILLVSVSDHYNRCTGPASASSYKPETYCCIHKHFVGISIKSLQHIVPYTNILLVSLLDHCNIFYHLQD